ncbi:hypothetical protein IT409_00525 [Candidatus Falkowbacteria bacterium]|nr:hypothetical protein [Candidatus Falkowbacteria bacterium]
MITVTVVILCVLAFFVWWYQSKKQADLQTLSHLGTLRSSLALTYSTTSHYPLAQTPTLIPNRDLVVAGYTGPSFMYQTDAKGSEYRIQTSLLVRHRALGLLKGDICISPQEITNGSCIIQ